MKNIRVFFLSENFQFFEVKFSIHLNRHIFVMHIQTGVCLCTATNLGYCYNYTAYDSKGKVCRKHTKLFIKSLNLIMKPAWALI